MSRTSYEETDIYQYAKEFRDKKLKARGVFRDESVKKTYVLYARKSTKTEKKQQKSIKQQVEACLEHAKKNNLEIHEIIREKGTAHKSGKRSEFAKMLIEIKKGTYNSILAWHPDRLARNLKESGEVMDMLDVGTIVDLQFPSFTFTNDGSGKLAIGIQFVLAKNYSDNVSTNTGRSINSEAEKGKLGKNLYWGYKLNKAKYIRPDGENFKIMQRAFEMAYERNSLEEIVKYINSSGMTFPTKRDKANKDSLSMKLMDPIYAGYLTQGETLTVLSKVDPKFQPVVSPQKFLEIRDILASSTNYVTTGKRKILFSPMIGMVKCSHCNSTMYHGKPRNHQGKRYLRFRCSNEECERYKTKELHKSVRGYVLADFALEKISSYMKITKSQYNKWLKDVQKIREETIKDEELSMQSLKSKIGNKESEISQLAIGLAKETDDDVKDSIRQTIKEEKAVLKELEQSYNESRTAVSNFRNLSDQKVWTYEKFVNFLKKLRAIIKNRKDDVLLDKAIRMVFVNFSVEDDKVASYKLKPAFETLEKLTLVVSGVENIEPRELFKLLNLIPLNLISKAWDSYSHFVSDSIAGINHQKIHYVV